MAAGPIKIPTRHDDPPWFLIWRFDEIIPIMAGICIGIAIRQLLICSLIGFAFTKVYQKVHARFPNGFVLHWLYGKGVWVFSS